MSKIFKRNPGQLVDSKEVPKYNKDGTKSMMVYTTYKKNDKLVTKVKVTSIEKRTKEHKIITHDDGTYEIIVVDKKDKDKKSRKLKRSDSKLTKIVFRTSFVIKL